MGAAIWAAATWGVAAVACCAWTAFVARVIRDLYRTNSTEGEQ